MAAGADTPDQELDLIWARQIVAESLRCMKTECEEKGRPDMWAVFEARVAGPELFGEQSPSYDDFVRQFGFQSPRAAWNALTTAKRMYERNLRAVVARYARDEEQVNAEIQDLQRILAKSGA